MNLERELAEEDCYQMLNQTLVGQRQNLRERKGDSESALRAGGGGKELILKIKKTRN